MSSDILDTLDDLDDLDDDILVGEVVAQDDEDDDFDDVLDLDDYEMSREKALEITEAVRSTATALYALVTFAHKHKAHKALGYETWADYVREEFDISAQRSYQLMGLAKTLEQIEAATPEGTEVKLTEAQARDIKRELPHITERIQNETNEMTPEEAAARAAEIIEESREEANAQKKAEDKAASDKAAADEQAELEAHQAGLEAAADEFLEVDRPEGVTDRADDGLLEVEVAGDGEMSAEDTMHVYTFFNMLSSIESLPEPDEMLNLVPSSRRVEVEEKLLSSTAWLNRFQTLFELQEDDD